MLGEGILRQRKSLVEDNDFLIFHHYAANFPWKSHALWFLTQMVRWGQVAAPQDLAAIADQVYLPDVYRQAAQAVGVAVPLRDNKTEGASYRPWILTDADSPIAMPRSKFIDGGLFDPNEPARYMESFLRHNMRVAPDDLG